MEVETTRVLSSVLSSQWMLSMEQMLSNDFMNMNIGIWLFGPMTRSYNSSAGLWIRLLFYVHDLNIFWHTWYCLAMIWIWYLKKQPSLSPCRHTMLPWYICRKLQYTCPGLGSLCRALSFSTCLQPLILEEGNYIPLSTALMYVWARALVLCSVWKGKMKHNHIDFDLEIIS